MLDTDTAGALVQFGTAGLIGWMWLSERRAAGTLERQLLEAHEKLRQERIGTEALLGAVRENTRVLGQIEAGQRSLLAMLGRANGPQEEARGRAGSARRAG